MAEKIKFSILIPAHNEEKYLPKTIEHIKAASINYPNQVEVIVTANRCKDRTVEIAEKFGAKVVYEDAKNLAKIRNAGAKAAVGEIIVTVDADSCVSPNILTKIHKALESGKNIGGSVSLKMERMSLGIFFNMYVIFKLGALFNGLPAGAGLYWCYRKDFEKIDGFKEAYRVAEDIDFAKRLKKLGKNEKKKFIQKVC
ncbi:MAG: glycosyltransferase [Bacteroidota bacterium]|nr:glycosyltransferase [Bacteroidota bacterium]